MWFMTTSSLTLFQRSQSVSLFDMLRLCPLAPHLFSSNLFFFLRMEFLQTKTFNFLLAMLLQMLPGSCRPFYSLPRHQVWCQWIWKCRQERARDFLTNPWPPAYSSCAQVLGKRRGESEVHFPQNTQRAAAGKLPISIQEIWLFIYKAGLTDREELPWAWSTARA